MSNPLNLNYLSNPHQHIQAHNSRRRPCSTIGHTSKQNSKEAAHLRTIPTLLMPTHINHTQSSPPYPVLPYHPRPPAQPDDTPATRTQDRPPSPDCTHSMTIQPTYMWLHHTHYNMQVPNFYEGTPVKTEAIRPARTLSPNSSGNSLLDQRTPWPSEVQFTTQVDTPLLNHKPLQPENQKGNRSEGSKTLQSHQTQKPIHQCKNSNQQLPKQYVTTRAHLSYYIKP